MTLHRARSEWYTLVRFDGTPSNLTAVAQTRTAAEAQALAQSWSAEFPADTTVIFNEDNAPISAAALATQIVHDEPTNAFAR